MVSDSIGLLLIALGSVPINDKLAHYASLWALSVLITVLIAIPLLLSILPVPKKKEVSHNLIHRFLPKIADLVGHVPSAKLILLASFVFVLFGAYFNSFVQVGEAEPGSPLLYPDHDYNISSKAINDSFPV